MKYKKYNKYKKILISVYNAHNNKNNNNKRVIGIAQVYLSAVLKIHVVVNAQRCMPQS